MDVSRKKLYPETSSLSVMRGRYTKGGDTDKRETRLGWWERDLSINKRHEDDITFLVDATSAKRPDLISYIVYGRHDLEWLVRQYNNIVDINEELVAGVYITLPSPDRALNDLTI